MTPDIFMEELVRYRSNSIFNPYSQRCSAYDLADAPDIRYRMMRSILSSASRIGTDSLWVGRDLGYRGGRRTGLAMTDDYSLYNHAQRWNATGERSTMGPMVKERTATAVWQLLNVIEVKVFLWNVFPFHPHRHDSPFSNRQHTSAEGRVGLLLLSELIYLLRPRSIVAIGLQAAGAVRSIENGERCIYVRHPSYGGQREFGEQMLKCIETL